MNITILRQKPALTVFIASAAIVVASGAAWAETNDDVRSDSERERVAAAAVEAVGGGRAVDVERSDDVGEAYEVEVHQKDGTEVDIALDRHLKVLDRENDDSEDDDRDDDDAGTQDNDDNPDLDDDADDQDDLDDAENDSDD